MADRFPSIEDFDEGQTEVRPTNGDADLLDGGADDPQSDFLSRERAALGDDADQFSTPQDAAASPGGDLLGGGGPTRPARSPGAMNGDEMSNFQSSFPDVDRQNDGVGPDGTVTGSGPLATNFSTVPEEEPAVIQEWRERRDKQIEQREETAESRKQETIKSAQQSVDEFYENYNNKKEKGITQTRKDAEEFLAHREDTTAGGTSWDRIARLVDVGKGAKVGLGGGEGKDKFRELLLGLSKDENAPGAKGY